MNAFTMRPRIDPTFLSSLRASAAASANGTGSSHRRDAHGAARTPDAPGGKQWRCDVLASGMDAAHRKLTLDGPMTTAELQDTLHFCRGSVQRYLAGLQEDNRVHIARRNGGINKRAAVWAAGPAPT